MHRDFTVLVMRDGYFLRPFAILSVHVWSILAVSGLFMALRAIPFCGKFLQWFAWCLLTIPLRIYFFVTKMFPTAQDILNIFIVKNETFLDTISIVLEPNIILKACLPNLIIIFVLIIMRFKKRFEYSPSKIARVLAFVLGVLFLEAYCRVNREDLQLKNSLGYSLSALRGAVVERENYKKYAIPREEFTARTFSSPKNNLVFILDESIRGDYLSINSPSLNTTPLLEKYLKDYHEKFFNYGLMVSTATNTFLSSSALLTGLNEIPDKKLKAFSAPTLFDIAKANGYKTVMIALQNGYPDFVIRRTDLARIDEVNLNDKEFEGNVMDEDLNAADIIRKRLTEEKGLFIYLNKIGMHVYYQRRYPVNDSQYNIFTPCLEANELFSLKKRRETINTYKNALRYNIDEFFKHLFGDAPEELKDCTIIYSSDHGESFYERGIALHSTGIFEQTIVPFLIFSTDSWVLENLKRPNEIPFTLHHMNIAPTIQSILCKDLNYHSGDYSSLVSVEDFKKPPLVYISKGTTWDGEISSPVSVDENGKIILPVEKYMY